jgi:iron only hydrogenase large subunit-like protein
MGWFNGDGVPEGDKTPETQSDGSSSTVSPGSESALVDAAKLHEVTSQMAERELRLREEATAKDAQLRQCENRVAAVERRIRERDAQVTTLKEERADTARQIENLKNQLYQLVSERHCSVCASACFGGGGGGVGGRRVLRPSNSFCSLTLAQFFFTSIISRCLPSS